MKPFRKSSLFTSLALGALVFSSGVLGHGLSPVAAFADSMDEVEIHDYGEESEIVSDTLSVVISSSSVTDNAQTYVFSASSSVTTYKNQARDGNIYFEIIDPAYDGSAIEEVETGAELPHYDVAVYRIYGTKSNRKDVYIPRKVIYDKRCVFEVVALDSDLFYDNYKNIDSVLVPDSVQIAYEGAFNYVPDGVSIKVMYEKDELPEGFLEGWIANEEEIADSIVWGYEPTANELKELDERFCSGTHEFRGSESYMFGYVDAEAGINKPLYMSYDVFEKEGGQEFLETRYHTFPIMSSNGKYDGIGAFANSISFNATISLAEDEAVDYHTIAIHNIFLAAKGDAGWAPLLEDPLYVEPLIHFSKQLHIDEFFTFAFNRIANFAGKTTIDLALTKSEDIYRFLNPLVYEERLREINNGNIYSRISLSSLLSASLRVDYLVGNETVTAYAKLDTPANYDRCQIVEGDQHIGISFADSYMGEGYSPANIIGAYLENFYVLADLYNPNDDLIIVRSEVMTNFGSLRLYASPKAESHAYLNLNLITALVAIIYAVAFIAGSIVLFFVEKNRFKNDEFRRVNPKRYWMEAGKNFLGYGFVTMFVYFCIGRWALFDNSIITFNPYDPFIIVSGIIAIVFIGLVIKNVVVSVKANAEKRRLLKLKIGQDAQDDGTN